VGCECVGEAAFYGCSGLQLVELGGHCRGIHDSAFTGCSALATTVAMDGSPTIGGWAFGGAAG
jgi:hypothetical protein